MATLTPAPSHAEPVVDQTGRATVPWYRWFTEFTQLVGQALLPSGVVPGTYGDSTHVAQVTVDAYGRITAAVSVPISGAGGGGSWIPAVTGSEPPTFVTDGAGVLVLVAYP
jgi:hypothetical protein